MLTVKIFATTAVAITMLPGSAFSHATGDFDIAPYLHAFKVQPAIDLLPSGTSANAIVVPATEEGDLEAMLRVAHVLASESIDIDADISRVVDEEFWNLV